MFKRHDRVRIKKNSKKFIVLHVEKKKILIAEFDPSCIDNYSLDGNSSILIDADKLEYDYGEYECPVERRIRDTNIYKVKRTGRTLLSRTDAINLCLRHAIEHGYIMPFRIGKPPSVFYCVTNQRGTELSFENAEEAVQALWPDELRNIFDDYKGQTDAKTI